MRLIELASLASLIFAVPAIGTALYTGSWKRRDGVPIGGIDTGKNDKDGKPIYHDFLQMFLLRRAMRITGMQALERGVNEKLGAKQTMNQMVSDFVAGQMHPWAGPSARFLYTSASGREPGFPAQEGYLLSKNPHDWSENVWAAVKNSNPALAAAVQEKEKSGSTGKAIAAPVTRIAQAAGFAKTGRLPSFETWAQAESQKQYGKSYEQLTMGERRHLVQQHDKMREQGAVTEQGQLAQRQASERDLWKKIAQQDALTGSLEPSSQAWLKQNRLHLPGFEAEKTLGGVRIPASRQQTEKMQAEIVGRYQQVVSRLQADPAFARLPSDAKQKRLANALAVARRLAVAHSLAREE